MYMCTPTIPLLSGWGRRVHSNVSSCASSLHLGIMYDADAQHLLRLPPLFLALWVRGAGVPPISLHIHIISLHIRATSLQARHLVDGIPCISVCMYHASLSAYTMHLSVCMAAQGPGNRLLTHAPVLQLPQGTDGRCTVPCLSSAMRRGPAWHSAQGPGLPGVEPAAPRLQPVP